MNQAFAQEDLSTEIAKEETAHTAIQICNINGQTAKWQVQQTCVG